MTFPIYCVFCEGKKTPKTGGELKQFFLYIFPTFSSGFFKPFQKQVIAAVSDGRKRCYRHFPIRYLKTVTNASKPVAKYIKPPEKIDIVI